MKFFKLLPLAMLAHTAIAAYAVAGESNQPPAQEKQTKLGTIWSTPEGLSLYTFAKDQTGKSNCYNDCAVKWPPLYAAANAKPAGDFSLVKRKDGTQQWAHKGEPLYTWIKDKTSTDVTGHGVKNVWFAARADDAPVRVFVKDGQQVLTDMKQLSLYTFDKDAVGVSNCYGKCAGLWPPLFADADSKAAAPFAIIKRDDGMLQWAVNGQPLYRWVKDSKPGDVTGDGVKGVWHLATWNK